MAKKKKIYKTLKFILKTGLLLAGLAVLAFVMAVFIFLRDLPRPEKFNEGEIIQSTKIYDRTGQELLYEIIGKEKRTYLPLDKIPQSLQMAVLTAEDYGFYQHQGIEIKGILRAILYDLKMGKPAQGGSTISQQLIRSYFLSQDRTIERKTKELVLTIQLERQYGKEQILEWYLNIIPFGSYLYGVEAASQTFFGKSATQLDLAESATLAGLIRAPSALSPYGDGLDRLMAIKNDIITRMANLQEISQEEAQVAKEKKLVFKPQVEIIKAPHFVMYVKQYLENKYGADYLQRAGLKVITTLDFDLQKQAERILKEKIDALQIYGANNAGMVAVDPKTGEVLAMVGSKDYFGQSYPDGCAPGVTCLFDPQVNVATANRQPGSAFKPFAYVLAFNQGLNPESLLWDVKTEFNPNCSPNSQQEKDKYKADCYHPRNYDGLYKGLISLREALAQSRNLPAIKVLYSVGIKETIRLATSLGISTLKDESRFGLALVLGGGEVKLLEMTAAYAIFANDGLKNPTNFILKITDDQNKVIETAKRSVNRVLDQQPVRLLNDVLSDNTARAPLFGWNSLLNIADYQVAVKTGTTQQYNDAWAVGYSPTVAVGVWVGNNNNAPTTRPGVTLAGTIWNPIMKYALAEFPNETFPAPDPTPASDTPMINGQPAPEPTSLLYYINKNDKQVYFWQYAINQYLGLPQE